MSEKYGIKIDDIFNTMEVRFRPEGAQGVDASFGYDMKEAGRWKLTVKDGKMKVEKTNDLAGCAVILKSDKDTYVGAQLGKIDFNEAFTAGKISIEGDIKALAYLAKMFVKFSSHGASPENEQELLVLKRIISINQRFATGPVMGKFLNGLKEKKIYANKCPVCGRLQLPPREVCAECRVRAGEFVEVGPKGNVRYMDIMYYASPDPLTGATRETPYGIAFILLDGCKGNETFAYFIRRDQLDRIKSGWNEKKGTIVRPVWAENRTGSVHDIPYFEIDE